MKNYQSWSQTEINLLSEYVSIYPENIRYALHCASKELGRTFTSCEMKYYREFGGEGNIVFSLITKTGTVSHNRKNVRFTDNTVPVRKKSSKRNSKKKEILKQIEKLIASL